MSLLKKASELSRKFVAQILLILIVALFAILKPDTFFTMDNLLTIIRQVATTGIVALGVSFLMPRWRRTSGRRRQPDSFRAHNGPENFSGPF